MLFHIGMAAYGRSHTNEVICLIISNTKLLLPTVRKYPHSSHTEEDTVGCDSTHTNAILPLLVGYYQQFITATAIPM